MRGSEMLRRLADPVQQSYTVAAIVDESRDALARARGSTRPRITSCRDRALDARLGDPASKRPNPAVLRSPDPSLVPAPAVLVSFHLGALMATGAFLEQLPHEVLIVQQRAPSPAPRLPTLELDGTSELDRVRLTRRLVGRLRAGACVFLAVDGTAASYVGMKALGRDATVAAGPFALARLGRAPMVPIAVRWRGRGVEVHTGQPIPPGDAATMAAALGEWYEQYASAHPREIRWPLLTLSGRLGLDRPAFQ